MIVIYEPDTGCITQCVSQVQGGLEKAAELYREQGFALLLTYEPFNFVNSYVVDGVVVDRPAVQLAMNGPAEIKADGSDEIKIVPDVDADLSVTFGGVLAHQQHVTAGEAIQIAAAQPGQYDLVFTPPFPHLPVSISVVAT